MISSLKIVFNNIEDFNISGFWVVLRKEIWIYTRHVADGYDVYISLITNMFWLFIGDSFLTTITCRTSGI